MEGCQNGDPAGSKVIKRMMSKVCRRPRMGRRNEKAKIRRKPSPEDTIFRKNSGPRARAHTKKRPAGASSFAVCTPPFEKRRGGKEECSPTRTTSWTAQSPRCVSFFFQQQFPGPFALLMLITLSLPLFLRSRPPPSSACGEEDQEGEAAQGDRGFGRRRLGQW